MSSVLGTRELSKLDKLNNDIMTGEESQDHKQWFTLMEYKDLTYNDDASQNQTLSVSEHTVTTYNYHGINDIEVQSVILDKYYIELMKKLHSCFRYKEEFFIYKFIYIKNYIDVDYKITVDIKQTDRFILKILYNNAELFHISLFTKDNYDGVPQIRGLHFTSPK